MQNSRRLICFSSWRFAPSFIWSANPGCIPPDQVRWSRGSYLRKLGSALHASVAGDVCLTSRLVRVNSWSQSALFHNRENMTVSGENQSALLLLWFFSPVRYSVVIVAIKDCNSLRACFTQGSLTHKHGAGEVSQSQYILSCFYHIRFCIFSLEINAWWVPPGLINITWKWISSYFVLVGYILNLSILMLLACLTSGCEQSKISSLVLQPLLLNCSLF